MPRAPNSELLLLLLLLVLELAGAKNAARKPPSLHSAAECEPVRDARFLYRPSAFPTNQKPPPGRTRRA